MEYPGASTVASQPLDRMPLPWLANPRNPAMSPHSRYPSKLIESVEGKKREGGWDGERRQTVARRPLLLPKDDCLRRTKRVETGKTSSASCLKTQAAARTQNANTLKRSWDESCEPALEHFTADREKTPAKLVAVNFIKYHLTKFKWPIGLLKLPKIAWPSPFQMIQFPPVSVIQLTFSRYIKQSWLFKGDGLFIEGTGNSTNTCHKGWHDWY